jgi:undecaprenyl-diphosphatase
MTFIQAIILGIVQGATEFLPISSSGHLVIVPFIFGWDIPNGEAFIFDVLVQVATLVAVFAYFWADIWAIAGALFTGIRLRKPFHDPLARLGWLLMLSMLPAVIFGLVLKSTVENAFGSPLAAAYFLLVTAGLLVIAERFGKRLRGMEQLTWIDALVIGLFQVFALFPGVSRSGATISGGMLRNLQRPAAARFAFLMSIPVMMAAGFLALLDLIALPNWLSLLPTYVPGFIAAAVVGYLVIRWLLGYLTRHTLYIFAAYCAILSLLTFLLLWIRA